MSRVMPQSRPDTAARVEWVDCAKAVSIMLVVMMHSTLGVSARMGDAGWMERIVEFAEPFRIPAFFLTAGLFLHRTIDRSWRETFDLKVVHFLFFYVAWLTVQYAFKGPAIALDEGMGAALAAWATGFVQPFGTLWFITVLPLFFVVVKWTHERGVPPLAVVAIGVVLHVAPIHSGWLLLDEAASRFVFFAAGAVLARQIFAFAQWTRREGALVTVGLAAWFVLQAGYVANGWTAAPTVSLALGGMGALALVAAVVRLSDAAPLRLLRWIGAHTLPIYLAFFLPMAVSRTVLVAASDRLSLDASLVAFLVTVSAVMGSILIYLVAMRVPYARALFQRPEWAHLPSAALLAHRPRTV